MANLLSHEVDPKIVELINTVNSHLDGVEFNDAMTILLSTMVMVVTSTSDALEEAIEDLDAAHEQMISNARANWQNIVKMRAEHPQGLN